MFTRLVIVCLFGTTEVSQSEVICTNWPITLFQNSSQYYCLDENKEFVYTQCLNDDLRLEPNCTFLQPKVLPECPDNFIDFENLCYQVTYSSYPPVCPFENVIPFEDYKDIVNDFVPIWVPAKREGLSFVQWREASWNFKTEVASYNYSAPLKDKECLVYNSSGFKLVSCSEINRGICAYNKLNNTSESTMCDTSLNCRQSDFSVKSKCYCQSTEISFNNSRAEFVKPYQYLVSTNLTNDVCSIGLEKTGDGKYLWINSLQKIDYTYWSPSVSFENGNIYGAATSEGWILTNQLLTCFIFEMEIEILEPSFQFEFNETEQTFLLLVKNSQKLKTLNSELLLFCFTNAYGFVQSFSSTKLLIVTKPTVAYTLYPLKNASGHYWCEAIKQLDLEIISTDRYFISQSNAFEFVAVFKVHYNNSINPLSSEIKIVLQEILQHEFMPSYVINVRPMEIIELDENAQEVLVNIHYTTSATDDEESSFENLKRYLESSFFNNTILVTFMSSDLCMSEVNLLTWPKTRLGSFAIPVEFCFTSEGIPVTRFCNGSFLEGARWSSFEECGILKRSTITNTLITTLRTAPNELSAVYNMLERYQDFTPLDVYLVTQMISEYFIYNTSDIETIGKIVANLLKIDRNVMLEAQKKSKASKKLLDFLNSVSLVYDDSFEFYSKEFVFVSLEAQNLSGLAVIKDADKFVVTKLSGNNLIKNITGIKNIESAIWLSPQYLKTLNPKTKITFFVYFNDVLFYQDTDLHANIVFGMGKLPYKNDFNGPVFITQRVHPDVGPYKNNCSFWDYSINSQESWQIRPSPQTKEFLVCDFWRAENYAIVSRQPSKNITDDLNNLFESNVTASETIERLAELSEEFNKFETIDLSFVEKILNKIHGDENVTLSHLAETISNVQQVKRDVLLQSQKEMKITDNILTYVDTIILSQKFSGMIQTVSESFIIVTFERKDNVAGVALLWKDGFYEPMIFTSNVSIEEVVQNDNFDSAVLLSEKLQAQCAEETKFVVTIHFTDTLFNEDSGKKQIVAKIFGVVLPEIEFVEPISLLSLKNTENDNHECVFWYYSSTISGFWKKGGLSKNHSTLVQCDFRHNTHLTYLILDDLDDTPDIYHFLDVVTSVNSIISLVSLDLILLTAVCFKEWRNNTGNRILLNFTFIIIIQIVVFYVSVIIDQEKNYVPCITVGVFLHYSIISQFCWMFVIAILQFRRFVVVLDGPPSYVLIKACVCGWILPLLPVVCVVSLDKESYVKAKSGLCYPSDLGLYLGVWLPIVIIIIINFVLFSITLYNIIRRKTESYGSSDVLYQWRLAVLLFFLLGFTWSFGFLAKLDFGLVFEFLFCMTATLQGFILFLFFIVCNANTRQLYVAAFRRYRKRKF